MPTINDIYKKWDKLNFDEVVEKTFYESESDIVDIQAQQMQDGKGKDGNFLQHVNSKKYTGVYKSLTNEIATKEMPILPKVTGDLYNFGWTGSFLSNLQIKLSRNEISIFSTGTGSGDKQAFFDGFKTLFGLNSESRTELIENRGFQNKLVKNINNEV